jgi:hypothetical protein
MDFFIFGCWACFAWACDIKSAGRIIKQLRLVLLLLVNRMVKRSADVEREVNLVGGHFALSVRFFVREEVLMAGFLKSISILGERGWPPL